VWPDWDPGSCCLVPTRRDRINPLLDSIHMLGEILIICWNALGGKYSRCSSVSQPSLGESEKLGERVEPTEPGEPSKVAIRGMEHAAVFDRQRGELGITDQRTPGLAIDDHLAK
jgi:hypothetical protein